MMAKCLECIHWKPCFNGKEWDAAIASPCKYFSPGIIVGGMTNADSIRAMSNEELATDLLDMFEEICEDGVPSKEWMMMWLKQSIKDGENE